MTATLTPQMMQEIVRDAAQIVAAEMKSRMESITLMSPSQAAGKLDVTANTLKKMPIPRYLVEGSIKYKVVDIDAYLETVRE
jgi:hypothetical protein